jgi:hypothetical protein
MKFEVWCLDLGSGPAEAKSFEADCPRRAAEKWADWEDNQSADYWIVGGTIATVMVRRVGEEVAQKFMVSGRTERAYCAKALAT